jgi:hypothetical protein
MPTSPDIECYGMVALNGILISPSYYHFPDYVRFVYTLLLLSLVT